MIESIPEIVVTFEPDAAPAAQAEVHRRIADGRLQHALLQPITSHAQAAVKRLQATHRSEAAMELHAQKLRVFSASVAVRSLDDAMEEVRALPGVRSAYWKPGVENPIAPRSPLDDMALDVPGIRPTDFREQQSYMDATPLGIDIAAAWQRPGGTGAGVQVIDVEGGWRFTHSDLLTNSGGLLAGTALAGTYWSDHGTAVLGILGGDEDPHGVCGIVPAALLSAVSHGGLGSAAAIEAASNRLRAGDVLLLEMHRPGPRTAFQQHPQQQGYIAVEWWPDDLLQIQSAVARGIIVVEAAGNGGEDLDLPLYSERPAQFHESWINPFGTQIDSGAIVVGAGAPASGVHGPARSRLDFSNFGTRLDCQGWGRGVVTTGYGDLYADEHEPKDQDYWYTRVFSGTSSASPIIAGVIAALSGIARAQGRTLTPAEVRHALRTTGSAQQAAPNRPVVQRIGSLPDAAALMAALGL